MSGSPEPTLGDGRLLTFEVGGVFYALPIAAVAEVAEVGRVAAVPTVPRRVCGVTNHHGDVLPVIERAALLPGPEGGLPAPQHLLVLADGPDDAFRYGLPVDAIRGLVKGEAGTALGEDAIAEHRPVDGRIVAVLDARRLRARAIEAIEKSVLQTDRTHGGQA